MKKMLSIKKTFSLILLISLILPLPTFASENLFYYFDNVNGLNSFKKNHNQVDILAPQVYEVGYDLKVSTPNSNQQKLLREARNQDSQVMPLLVNKSFDKVLMSDILINSKAQDDIIKFLIKEAKAKKYIGWQFDFENINHLDRSLYTAFVKKTYKKFQVENLKLSVAVVVRDDEYDSKSKNQDWSSAYEYKNLANNSDFLTLMTYDDPGSNGPTSSLAFVQSILDYILTQAPANKLSLGIPAYCWQWQDGKRVASVAYSSAEKAYNTISQKNRSKGFDKDLGEEYFKFLRDGVQNVIWCNNAQSFELKDKLIADKGLRGFSMWALGQEDSDIWRYLKNK